MKTSRSIYSFLKSSQGAQFSKNIIKKATQNFDFGFFFVTPMKNFSMSLHSTGLSRTPVKILGSYDKHLTLYDRPKNVTFGRF